MRKLTLPFTPASNLAFNSDISSTGLNTIKSSFDNYLASQIVSPGYAIITGAMTLSLTTNQTVLASGTTAYTITLPNISTINIVFDVKKISENKNGATLIPVTINAGAGQTIEGNATYTLYTKNSFVTLVANSSVSGLDWKVISSYNNIFDLQFLARKDADQTPAAVGAVTAIYETDSGANVYDYNNDYATATSLYTAPYSGDYTFSASLYILNGTSTAIEFWIFDRVKQRIAATADIVVLSGVEQVRLTAGQTVRVVVDLKTAVRVFRGSGAVPQTPSIFAGRCVNILN